MLFINKSGGKLNFQFYESVVPPQVSKEKKNPVPVVGSVFQVFQKRVSPLILCAQFWEPNNRSSKVFGHLPID